MWALDIDFKAFVDFLPWVWSEGDVLEDREETDRSCWRRKRTKRPQKEWDRKYGEGKWAVGYKVKGEFLSHEDAVEEIYQASYDAYLDAHPEDVETLVKSARRLRNPHAEATSGVDLQVPAILHYLKQHGLRLEGAEVVDIGSWQGSTSHPISTRLSPLQIPCVLDSSVTLEGFWQEQKCLAIWEDPLWSGDEDEEDSGWDADDQHNRRVGRFADDDRGERVVDKKRARKAEQRSRRSTKEEGL